MGDTLIVIGGVNGRGVPVSDVTRLRWSEGKLVSTPLPSLPHPLVGAGAAVVGNTLLVIGGMLSVDADHAEAALWALDLNRSAAAWRELEPLPGPGRVLPIVAAQYDVLHVFGGRTIAVAAGRRSAHALAETWIYRLDPLESTTQRGWQRRASAPQPLAGGAAVPTGQAQVLLVGGDPEPSPASVLALTAHGPQPVRLYHTETDAWVDAGVAWAAVGPVAAALPAGGMVIAGGTGSHEVGKLAGVRTVRNLAVIDYVVIAAYFAGMALIGFYFSRQQETSSEFSLGSRNIKWWAAGISMFATGASAISFMAIPALAFATNLVWLFPSLILVGSFFINSRLIYPLLRRMEITSTYEYLERRFNRPLRLLASAQQILFQVFGRATVVLVLPALAISATTGINVFQSVIIMGALTTVYTAIGGFKAVIWTEVLQGVLKFIAPVVMIAIAISSLPGGLGEFVRIGQTYHKFDFALVTWDVTVPAVWLLVLKTLLESTLQQAGDQPIIQRVFSAPPHEVRRVSAMMVTCSILISALVNVMGIAIFAYFHAHPAQFDAGAQNDQIVPLFAVQAMPSGLAGLIVAAIFASAMATVASSMNSVATIFTEDFYRRLRPAASDAVRLRVLRTTCYLAGIVATGMALVLAAHSFKSMMATWNEIYALLGGGVVGVYSLGMFTRRANGRGAVVGAVVSVIAVLLVKAYTPLHWAFYTPVGIFSCMGAGYLCSCCLPEPERDLAGLTVFTPRRAT